MSYLSGTIVTTDPDASARCMIGYENLLELGEVATFNNAGVEFENDDHPVENAYDWLTTDFFKPDGLGTTTIELTLDEGREADYLGIYAHDFDTAPATIQLQYHDGSTWQDATPAVTPANRSPLMQTFTAVLASRWRLVIVALVDIPSLGVVSFGKALYTNHGVYIGYSEPLLARDNELINSVSERGTFLGRSVIASGFSTNLVLQYATDQWVRDYWLPFVRHAECKPFFYLWNVEDYPHEAAFCWTEGKISPPTHTHYGYMGTSIPIRGKTE